MFSLVACENFNANSTRRKVSEKKFKTDSSDPNWQGLGKSRTGKYLHRQTSGMQVSGPSPMTLNNKMYTPGTM